MTIAELSDLKLRLDKSLGKISMTHKCCKHCTLTKHSDKCCDKSLCNIINYKI